MERRIELDAPNLGDLEKKYLIKAIDDNFISTAGPFVPEKFKITIPEIQERLKIHSVPSRRIFLPIVDFPPYQQYKKRDYPNSYYLYENGLNLPGSTLNTDDNVYYTAEIVLKVLDIKL